MKKIFAMVFAAFSLAACNNNKTEKTVDTTDTVDTTAAAVNTGTRVDTSIATTTTSTAYTPAEGDVIYRDKKVMVRRNGQWVKTDEEVKMDNDVVVYRNGKVRKDGKEIELKEGETVSKTGNFFDKAGHAIDNAWDATKEGVKDAGQAVKKTAHKIGAKVDDAVDGDKKD